MRKHTTLNIDPDLVAEAQEVLGTKNATDTIHAALDDIVRRNRRRRLLTYDLPDLTPEALEEMRSVRRFGSAES
jgi:Arc/MetJ family transcription regulator